MLSLQLDRQPFSIIYHILSVFHPLALNLYYLPWHIDSNVLSIDPIRLDAKFESLFLNMLYRTVRLSFLVDILDRL